MPSKFTVLKVSNLTKRFGGRNIVRAVDEISFSLKEGEILGLLGPNGAGKTTTIQMLLSTLKPSSGDIIYFGNSLEKQRRKILQEVGYASAYTSLPALLTVEENLTVFGMLYGLKRNEVRERTKKFLSFFGAADLLKRQSFSLSAGQRTRVMLAKAFLSYPKIVLLDEPTASLDPDVAHEVRKFVLEQRRQYGVSMLYTSHNMDEVTEVCDSTLFLKRGRIIAWDTPRNLADSIATTRVSFAPQSGTESLMNILKGRGLVSQQSGENITITIEEHQICDFFAELSNGGVRYTHLSVERPTLEEYFLYVAKEQDS